MIVEGYAAICALALAYVVLGRKNFVLVYLFLAVCLGVAVYSFDLSDPRMHWMSLCFLIVLVAPVIIILGKDLKGIADELGWRKLLVFGARSLVLWLPIGLLALASVLIIEWRNTKITEEIYNLPQAPWSAWNGACDSIICKDDGPDLRRDLHAAVYRIGAALKSEVSRLLNNRLSQIDLEAKDAGAALTRSLFHPDEGMLPDTFSEFSGLDIPKCNWVLAIVWPPAMRDCLKRSVLKPIDKSYRKIRTELQDDVSAALKAGQGKIEGGTDAVRSLILDPLDQKIDGATDGAIQSIDRLFLIGLIAAIVSWVVMVMVTVKSYLTILARHVFDTKSGGINLSVGKPIDRDQPFCGEDISRTDGANGYKFPLCDQVWYGSFGHIVRPIEYGRPTYPVLGQLFFQRLLTGKLRMQRFDPDRFDEIGGQADFSSRFVRVDLKEKERLYFNLKNLTAFSQGLTFRSIFSLKLAAILQYRLFFPVAEGPGSLILRVDGGTMRLMPPNEPEGADPMDLAAFDWSGAFALRAQHDFLSVYSEGYTIVPEADTFVIRHAPQRLSRRGGKFLRKTLFFLLPI